MTNLLENSVISFHILTVVDVSLHGFITSQHYDQLPVGLLALLVEREVPQRLWVQIPKAYFHCSVSGVINAKITFIPSNKKRWSHIRGKMTDMSITQCFVSPLLDGQNDSQSTACSPIVKVKLQLSSRAQGKE